MMQDKHVDIAVAGRFHAYHLASALASIGRLGELFAVHRTFHPPRHVDRKQFHNRFDLALWGALSRFAPVGYTVERKFDMFDEWLAKTLERKSPGVLHSWNGSSRKTFKRLKGTGWRLCLERSCPHNGFQYSLLKEEGETIGIPHVQDMRALEGAIEELYLADVIVAPSSYSARSYVDPELIQKVRVNPLGANYHYRERAVCSGGLKVLMVGNSFLRKGTHYLVEAFKRFPDANAELWIRGEVPDQYRRRITDPRIKIIPPLLPDRLQELYSKAHIFVQPSIDEGFGMTVFEALAYGLPLIVTENVGAADVLSSDVAITVPIRDPDAIVDAFEMARSLPGESFDARRKLILGANNWNACAARMIAGVYSN